jgi:hypothetical protein
MVLPALSQWRVGAGVYKQRVRAPPFSSPPPSNSEAERDASKAACFSTSIQCQLDCAAPFSGCFRRGIYIRLVVLARLWTGMWVVGYGVAIIASYRGESPARRDKRDVLCNVLSVRAVYLLPVHGSGEEEHGLGVKPCSFSSEPCSYLANRNTSKSDIFGTWLASRIPLYYWNKGFSTDKEARQLDVNLTPHACGSGCDISIRKDDAPHALFMVRLGECRGVDC